MSDSKPRVSVSMITYNHERYIKQAVESVIEQRTDFEVEFFVGEDCSTDGTRRVLLELSDRYPSRFRMPPRERNLGPGRNFLDILASCRGEFIAFLEGDDYWTDPLKLQKQVDAMDAHPGWSMCFHPARYVDESGEPLGGVMPPRARKVSNVTDVITSNFIQTCSAMLRAESMPSPLPEWFEDLPLGDWPMFVMTATSGGIGFLEQTMAAYRVHGGGTWTSASVTSKADAATSMLRQLGGHLGEKYAAAIDRAIAHVHLDLLVKLAGDDPEQMTEALRERPLEGLNPKWVWRYGRRLRKPSGRKGVQTLLDAIDAHVGARRFGLHLAYRISSPWVEIQRSLFHRRIKARL